MGVPDSLLEPPYKKYITRYPTALEHLNNLPKTPALTAYLEHTRTVACSLTLLRLNPNPPHFSPTSTLQSSPSKFKLDSDSDSDCGPLSLTVQWRSKSELGHFSLPDTRPFNGLSTSRVPWPVTCSSRSCTLFQIARRQHVVVQNSFRFESASKSR